MRDTFGPPSLASKPTWTPVKTELSVLVRFSQNRGFGFKTDPGLSITLIYIDFAAQKIIRTDEDLSAKVTIYMSVLIVSVNLSLKVEYRFSIFSKLNPLTENRLQCTKFQ